jgi:23S rRNA (adenine1618-N6)-methyltransferase
VNSPKKTGLHPRNPHQGRYDFSVLTNEFAELKAFIKQNPAGEDTIDFSDNKAVLALNKALLAYHYQVEHWQIPEGYLCPPIPGRADYIHYVADLLAKANKDKAPRGKKIAALDIGTGANGIYPIIGSQSYGWQFTAVDIDPVSINTVKLIAESNPNLKKCINVRQQNDSKAIFNNILTENDYYDLTLCNPPFHASLGEAQASNQRKQHNLNKAQSAVNKTQNAFNKTKSELNFGGQKAELWCPGGEIRFLKQMCDESKGFASQVCWFTTLVSKSENIAPLKHKLKKLGAQQIEVINMQQGHKISRLLAWSFLNAKQQENWALMRW